MCVQREFQAGEEYRVDDPGLESCKKESVEIFQKI